MKEINDIEKAFNKEIEDVLRKFIGKIDLREAIGILECVKLNLFKQTMEDEE